MEIERRQADFKCDSCDQLGIIKYSETDRLPISEGTWFFLSTQGCGVSEQYCSIRCVQRALANMRFNKQTVVIIEKSLIWSAND